MGDASRALSRYYEPLGLHEQRESQLRPLWPQVLRSATRCGEDGRQVHLSPLRQEQLGDRAVRQPADRPAHLAKKARNKNRGEHIKKSCQRWQKLTPYGRNLISSRPRVPYQSGSAAKIHLYRTFEVFISPWRVNQLSMQLVYQWYTSCMLRLMLINTY